MTDIFEMCLPDPIVDPILPDAHAHAEAAADPPRAAEGPDATPAEPARRTRGQQPPGIAAAPDQPDEPGQAERATGVLALAQAAAVTPASRDLPVRAPTERPTAALVLRPAAGAAVQPWRDRPHTAIPALLRAPDGPGCASALVRVPSCPQLAPGAQLTIVWSAASGTGMVSRMITETQDGQDVTFVIPPGQIGAAGVRVHYEVEAEGTRLLSRTVVLSVTPDGGRPE